MDPKKECEYFILNTTMNLKRILQITDIPFLNFLFSRRRIIFVKILISLMASFEIKIVWQHPRSQW